MKGYKIGYFADGPWAHRAFELLMSDEAIDIAFIVPRSDTKDSTLKKYALNNGIDYLHPVNVNSKDFLDKVRGYNCDLFVSMSFDQIFKEPLISLPRDNTINCHAGMLPFYRGRNVINWAIINDEKEIGITVHFMDEGIDTGDIVLQKAIPIHNSDNYNTILNTAYKECAELLYEAVMLISGGRYDRIVQSDIHPVGFYCGRRRRGDEVIDWNSSSREVFNFVRALCHPGPKATTFMNGEAVRINAAVEIEGAPAYVNTPGQVLAKTDKGFLVKTKDSFIEIQEVETETKVRVGDRFSQEGQL